MTDFCNFPSEDDDRKGKADAPAIAVKPLTRRLLRALSDLPRKLASWLRVPRERRPLGRLHRLNDHMLRDIGLAREEDEDLALLQVHPLIRPPRKRDDPDR